MNKIIANPFSIYLKRLANSLLLEFKLRKQKLRIGYMSCAYNCKFGFHNTIYDYSSVVESELGDFTYISNNVSIVNTKIGKFCSIGPGVQIGLGKHPSRDFVSTHPSFYSIRRQAGETFADKNYFNEYEQINIGNDVWIGANAIVLDGITIGDGAIIGTGAVVTRDIEPYSIVGGIPAKLIRYRFDKGEIETLLKYRWWNKDINWLRKNYKNFHNVNSIGNFK